VTDRISVVIVTFYREAFLRRTLRSCLAQRDIDPASLEILVVDGSPNSSARCVVEASQHDAAAAGIALRYVHEPRPGISHSRNAGVQAATADLVAFIDDDEEADPLWLSRMLACQKRYNADIVLGPVFPVFELENAGRDPFWRWYFTADTRQPSGAIAQRGGGTHNCLLVKQTCCASAEPFDPALGLTGGEDSRFFHSVVRRGGRVVWCADAVIHEFVPASRSSWTYAMRRRFRENQLLMQSFIWSDPPNLTGVAAWMVIGFMQLLVFAPLALLVAAFNRSIAKKCITKAIGGVGKLMWFPGLTLVGYGDRTSANSETYEANA